MRRIFTSSLNIPTRIPIAVQPAFLLLTAYLGFSFGRDTKQRLIGAAMAAVAILWHELAHAGAARCFGGKPKITLTIYGGQTHSGCERPLPLGRELAFILGGPASTLLLAALSLGLLKTGWLVGHEDLLYATAIAYGINLTWGILNLFPAMPFDGGNALRALTARFIPEKGHRWVYGLSGLACAALAIYCYFRKDWLLLAFAYYSAFSNARLARQLMLYTHHELKPENLAVLERLEALEKKKDWENAYRLLEPLEPILGDRNLFALALFACRTGRFEKAESLAERLYAKRKKDPLVAFILARAHAGRGDVARAAEWLRAAVGQGLPNASVLVERCAQFDAIRAEEPIRRAVSRG